MKALAVFGLLLIVTSCSRDRQSGTADSLAGRSTSRSGPQTLPAATDTPPPGPTARATGVTAPEKASINGVVFGAHEADVRQLLGSPDSITSHARDTTMDLNTTSLHYKGLAVLIAEGKVVGLRCAGPTCTTGDGVRVGASASEVERVYGPARRAAGPGGVSQLAYGFTTDGKCALRFKLSGDVVNGIEVSCK